MRPTDTYLVILGDVVASRHVEDREDLRGRLRDGLREIDTSFRAAFATQPDDSGPVRPEISAGDEIQILLRAEGRRPGTSAVTILDVLTAKLRPYRIVFGVGIGTLTTRAGGVTSVQELDGSCFHHAREAIAKAKSQRRWAVVVADPGHTDPSVTTFERAANAILRLTGDIRAGWTDRQTQVMWKFHAGREETPLQKDVAKELDVSPSVISEVLRAARRDAVHEGDVAVASLLNHMALPPDAFRILPQERP